MKVSELGGYDSEAIQSTSFQWNRRTNLIRLEKPFIKWEATFPNNNTRSSLVIGKNEILYFGGEDGYLYAVNKDGTLHWKFEIGRILNTPSIGADGTIYVSTTGSYKSVGHKLYAVTPDGKQKWCTEIGDTTYFSPVIDEQGTVYITSGNGKLHAISPDGTIKWIFECKYKFWSLPTIGPNGEIYIASNDQQLYALHSNGQMLWSLCVGQGHGGSILSVDTQGNLLINSSLQNQFMIKIINPNGSIIWTYTLKDGFIASQPVVGEGGALYFGASEFRLFSIDFNHNVLWMLKHEGFMIDSPIFGADGTLYFGTQIAGSNKTTSNIYAVDVNGTVKWVQKIKGAITFPAFSKDCIYVLANNFSKNYTNPTATLCAIGDKKSKR
jgi:outer membrane protein assembly factor BamB